MYNIGLDNFLRAKQLKSKATIDSFLLSQNITSFTSKNHNRVNNYIQNNWIKFASFVDKGLKSGTLEGKAVKLNTYYDEQREYNNQRKTEINTLSSELIKFSHIVKKYDSIRNLSHMRTFCMNNNIPLPRRLEEGNSHLYKSSPILNEILNHPLKDKCIEYMKERWLIKNTNNQY